MTTMKSKNVQTDPRDRRHLVIGSTGLLGRHIVRELAGRRWPVRAMRRWDSDASGLDFPDVDFIVGDVFESAMLKEAIAGANAVVYCAAPDPSRPASQIIGRSVEAIRRVLDTCRDFDVDRLVVTSSASTMGCVAPGQRISEDDYYLPGSSEDPFAEAKYAVEQECWRHIADGFPVVILNPTLFVGPGVDLKPYARLRVSDDQPLNTVDIREVARIHAEAIYDIEPGRRYLLGGENTTAGALFDGWSSRGKNEYRPRDAYLVDHGQWVASRRALVYRDESED